MITNQNHCCVDTCILETMEKLHFAANVIIKGISVYFIYNIARQFTDVT